MTTEIRWLTRPTELGGTETVLQYRVVRNPPAFSTRKKLPSYSKWVDVPSVQEAPKTTNKKEG